MVHPNSASAQIARALGSETPTTEAIKRLAEGNAVAAPPVTRSFVPACDQVAALFGSSTPTPEQFAAYDASSASGRGDSGKADITTEELQLLAELEADAGSIAAELIRLADETDAVFDAASKAGTDSGLAPIKRATRPSIPLSTAAAKRSSRGGAVSTTNPSSRTPADGAAAAVVTVDTPQTAAVWGSSISTIKGNLFISVGDTVLERLRGIISSSTPRVTVTTGKGGESSLACNEGKICGTTAILFALFPGLLGESASVRAQVMQWCMDSVDPKYNAAESEPMADKKRAATAKIMQVLNKALTGTAYFAGNTPTVADLALWAAMKGIFPGLHQAERETLPHLTRWFKHVQTAPGLTTTPVVIASNCVTPLGAH